MNNLFSYLQSEITSKNKVMSVFNFSYTALEKEKYFGFSIKYKKAIFLIFKKKYFLDYILQQHKAYCLKTRTEYKNVWSNMLL